MAEVIAMEKVIAMAKIIAMAAAMHRRAKPTERKGWIWLGKEMG